ncbi:MAG: exo-alpha-sialidase [Phycisphaerae bacterium]|nr:exo-alpha-sialidase [Phycisphaerae bacterium]
MKKFKGVSLISEGLAEQYRLFHLRRCLEGAGYDKPEKWHQPISSTFGHLPKADMRRITIYRAREQIHSYSHHSQVCRFHDKYFIAWSNGLRNEDEYGQEIRYRFSDDGVNWEPFRVLTPNDPPTRIIRMAVGVYTTDELLVVYCRTCWDSQAAEEGMTSHESQSRLDAFVTRDLQNWDCHENVLPGAHIFEGPRLTSGGRLMCCGSHQDKGPIAIFWDTQKPWIVDKVVEIPRPEDAALFPYGEASWYQNLNGRIWVFFRDEAQSLRLYASWSDDEGQSWQVPVITDIPDSMSRVSAGRLTDGPCYLVSNAFPQLLWRKYLMLSISSDGEIFDKMYLLADEPTTRRIDGRHKEDGYQYPHTLVEGEKLFVAYSVNKEDIEVGIIDLTKL